MESKTRDGLILDGAVIWSSVVLAKKAAMWTVAAALNELKRYRVNSRKKAAAVLRTR